MQHEEPKIKNEEEEVEQIKEELDFTKPDYIFLPTGNHLYKQSGYYLICQSCDLGHAIHIGSEKVMVGQGNDGLPILKTRKELGIA